MSIEPKFGPIMCYSYKGANFADKVETVAIAGGIAFKANELDED